MTLDLTKPMRWKSDHTPVIVLWSDDNDTFAEWQPPDDEPVRQHMRTEWFSERVENIPPEPPKPVGPDEVTVSVWPDGAMSLMHGHPPAVQVRYLRADLAARKVKPLTSMERYHMYVMLSDEWFTRIMAARGIEVGE